MGKTPDLSFFRSWRFWSLLFLSEMKWLFYKMIVYVLSKCYIWSSHWIICWETLCLNWNIFEGNIYSCSLNFINKIKSVYSTTHSHKMHWNDSNDKILTISAQLLNTRISEGEINLAVVDGVPGEAIPYWLVSRWQEDWKPSSAVNKTFLTFQGKI